MGSEREVADFISSPRKPQPKQVGPFPRCKAGDGQRQAPAGIFYLSSTPSISDEPLRGELRSRCRFLSRVSKYS